MLRFCVSCGVKDIFCRARNEANRHEDTSNIKARKRDTVDSPILIPRCPTGQGEKRRGPLGYEYNANSNRGNNSFLVETMRLTEQRATD